MPFLACAVAGCDRSTPDAGAMLERGLRELEAGNNEKAIAAFTESLRLRPNDADALYNRGLAQVRLGNFDAARADYSEALKLRPEFTEAYTNRAVTYAHRGRLDEAIADCTAALRLNPKSELALRNRGLAYHDQGKYDLALADFNDALRLNADLAEAYFNRAHTFLKLGRTPEASADFAEAWRLDKDLDVPVEFRTAKSGAAAPTLPEPVLVGPAVVPAPDVADSPNRTALDLVADMYAREGYTVEPATEPETCQFVCRREQDRVRLEVKTVTREDEPLHLSADEVNRARDPSTRTDLVVVLAPSETPADGKSNLQVVSRLIDWNPRPEELTPTEFEYRAKPVQGQ